MYLTHRFTTLEDLDGCFDLVAGRMGYSASRRVEFVSLWKELISSRSALSLVVEDRDQPAGHRLVGFGLLIIGTEAFANELDTNLPPYIPEQVLERWQGGQKCWLDEVEIREAQAEAGVFMIVLTWGVDVQRYDSDNAFKIKLFQSNCFRAQLATYRIKKYYEEGYSAQEREILQRVGLRIMREYPPHPVADSAETLPACLTFMTVADMLKAGENLDTPGGKQALLGPPRFSFRQADQAVLRIACEGKTDDQIAAEIGVSAAAIKKRWQAIYERVEEIDPELFHHDSETQGAQRRRKLLSLIREHPEELWPIKSE